MTEKASLLDELRIERAPPRRRTGQPLLRAVGAVAVLALAALGAWWGLGPAAAVPVRVALVQAPRTGSSSLLDAAGYVVARRAATVSAKIEGKVVEVRLEEGQHVSAGQVIARLDDSNTAAALALAQTQVAQAEASLAAARVALANAEPIYRRAEKLRQMGWLSQDGFDTQQASYDTARTALAVAQRGLEVAEASRLVAQRNEDDTVVRAPFDGVVTVKAAQPGEIVSPLSAGGFTRTGIATIVDMDSLELEIDVSEAFINRVEPGQPATVRLNAYPDWEIPAAVIAVIPTADRSKATVKVRVGLKLKDPRILPEMGARVAFLAAAPAESRAAPGLVVPAEAVMPEGTDGAVFVIHGDTVERRTVRLGGRSAAGQTVLSGVSAGDRLAVGALARLADGSKVRIEE